MVWVATPASTEETRRRAWRYVQGPLTVTITHVSGNRWVAERSDGKRPAYDEIERSPESFTLQNRESRLLVRLFADRAEWRRPKDERWTPWVQGGWVDAAPAPAPAASVPGPVIRVLYFVPAGRAPVANYAQKIRVITGMVAEVYLRDLRGRGYRTEGLRFDQDAGETRVQLIRGERNASYYNNAPGYDANEQWKRLGPEIRRAGDPQRQVLLVFAETYDEGPAEHLWPGVIARGAYHTATGGLAIFSGHLLRDEFCAVTTLSIGFVAL